MGELTTELNRRTFFYTSLYFWEFSFKTSMRLTISNLRKDDFGYYHCVARNELNATMVNFEVARESFKVCYTGKPFLNISPFL